MSYVHLQGKTAGQGGLCVSPAFAVLLVSTLTGTVPPGLPLPVSRQSSSDAHVHDETPYEANHAPVTSNVYACLRW